MKKLLYMILLMLTFFLSTQNASAVSCDNTEYNEKFVIANNIKISYQHIKEGNFDLVISNMPKDLFLIDDFNEAYIYGTDKNITLHNYMGGAAYNFRVFSKSGTCKNLRILVKSISLPKYNGFAESDYCVENPTFKYCDPWYKGYISSDDIVNEIVEYESNKETIEPVWYNVILQGIANFAIDNLLYIIAIAFVIIILIILLIIRKRRSKRGIKL